MSKFFFKGRIDHRQDHQGYGYQNRGSRPQGSKSAPLSLSVSSESRKAEIDALLAEHSLFANVELNADQEENIIELDVLLNKPATVMLEQTPSRNDPCSCGSGKKYKKCCG
jgi:SWIM/SEC-C metal-binding protein